MSWFSEIWDRSGVGDAVDSSFRAAEDAVTDTSKGFSDAGEFLVNTLWHPILGRDPIDADNIDDWDPATLAAVMSFIPGPWQPFAMAYNAGSGIYDMSQNGVNLQNTLQVAPSAVGAFKGFNAANAAGANPLMGAGKGAVGLPAATPSAAPTSTGAQGAPMTSAAAPMSTTEGLSGGTSALSQAPQMTPLSGTQSLVGGGVGDASGRLVAQSAPQTASSGGRGLLEKFGDFATNQIDSAAKRQQVGNLVGAAFPQPQGLFPEGRTPASGYGIDGGYGTEGALARFNPGSLTSGGDPVSADEYNTGIKNLYDAKQRRVSGLFQTEPFRGQTPTGNTALANQLSNANKGFDEELNVYNKEIQSENDRRGNAMAYKSLRDANKFTDEQMTEYINLAKLGDDEISKRVADPVQFKKYFGSLSALV